VRGLEGWNSPWALVIESAFRAAMVEDRSVEMSVGFTVSSKWLGSIEGGV